MKNYDGDVQSELVTQDFDFLYLMNLVLVSADGKAFEFGVVHEFSCFYFCINTWCFSKR